jgi:hypothetical protein
MTDESWRPDGGIFCLDRERGAASLEVPTRQRMVVPADTYRPDAPGLVHAPGRPHPPGVSSAGTLFLEEREQHGGEPQE